MLKRSKKIISAKKSVFDAAEEWLEITDYLQKDNNQILFDKIFIEETEYTIKELSVKTNFSERTIFRKIKLFEDLIEIIGKMQEKAVENKNKKDF